jgi:hypothetical protein
MYFRYAKFNLEQFSHFKNLKEKTSTEIFNFFNLHLYMLKFTIIIKLNYFAPNRDAGIHHIFIKNEVKINFLSSIEYIIKIMNIY